MAHTVAVTTGRAAAPPRNSLGTNAGFVLIHAPVPLPVAYPFLRTRVLIGRDAGMGLDVIFDVTGVSRQHAAVDYRDGRWILRDLASTNGTFVNGRRIDEAALDPAAIVRIGDCVLRFVPAGVESYAHYDLDGALVGHPFEGEEIPPGRLEGGYRMHRLARAIHRVAASPVGVVLVGERGADKERCALELHDRRGRRGAFARVDCGDRSTTWIGDALAGLDVDGGTLLLDDADALSAEDADDLARILAGRGALPAAPATARGGPYRAAMSGPGGAPIAADIVVGLRDPARPAAQLAAPAPAYAITLMPLRDRKESLRAHVRRALQEMGRPDVTPGIGFMLGLAHHDFPGDVAELSDLVKIATDGAAGGALLDAAHLPAELHERIGLLYTR